ncbi:ORF207 [Staphylococcus phage X2]|uniref:ORF207 n=1 Tax=Staphylococcus phage X2 TaxID=2908152 RepID=Q4ZA82_9CAUD|nr:ORF207 [Staphylococcus phage X2]AAX92082.1 ORF207 [Staphylococcus phage X2]
MRLIRYSKEKERSTDKAKHSRKLVRKTTLTKFI